jgi:hypothetical protein
MTIFPLPLSCALLHQLLNRAMSYAAAQDLQVEDHPSLGRFRLPDAAAAARPPILVPLPPSLSLLPLPLPLLPLLSYCQCHL